MKIIINAPAPRERDYEGPGLAGAFLLYLIASAGLLLSDLPLLPFASSIAKLNPQIRLLLRELVYYLPFVVLPVFLLYRRKTECIPALRPEGLSARAMIVILLFGISNIYTLNGLSVLWAIPFQKLGFDVYSSSFPSPTTKQELILAIFTTGVVPGICEELLFRGTLLPALERGGTQKAILLNSLLFAVMHGNFLGFPSQFLMGVILCCLVVYTDSIYAGIILHTINNSMVLIIDYVQDTMIAAEVAAGNTSTLDNLELAKTDYFAALGGISGALSRAFSVALGIFIIVLFLRMFKFRARMHAVPILPKAKLSFSKGAWILLTLALLVLLFLHAANIMEMLGIDSLSQTAAQTDNALSIFMSLIGA